ncbi:MAG: flagellar hook capping FlgD N-terminal domain-containing protein [Candidatus Andeanibacterium colombiense]|uniref:Basal-body rod modification protein FlgD n=1 Tax=Candidatus Andeanibacterium colombiense TaxID=3121345 RepID=A0AAJ6BNZ6_9SPHN|nr:MAG: flagellar hook capping FlgD N-terminal domain-containing protein [Sphingomonadaceae bacterium]
MASTPITGIGGSLSGTSQNSQDATAAFGLGFEDLLKIVLTQLTYQDPLKPMDNFQFVSQLAQFAQIQQTQSMADNLQTLVSAESSTQAASLLGKIVDIQQGPAIQTGKVIAIVFGESGVSLTVQTATLQIPDIPLSSVLQIKEAS